MYIVYYYNFCVHGVNIKFLSFSDGILLLFSPHPLAPSVDVSAKMTGQIDEPCYHVMFETNATKFSLAFLLPPMRARVCLCVCVPGVRVSYKRTSHVRKYQLSTADV